MPHKALLRGPAQLRSPAQIRGPTEIGAAWRLEFPAVCRAQRGPCRSGPRGAAAGSVA